MQLTEHFKLEELTRSAVAVTHGIVNIPTEADIKRLRYLCETILEPLRMQFGVLRITSGFRCEALNNRVKGSKTSAHLRGEAADIHMSTFQEAQNMIDYAVEQHIPFDQMIIEHKRSTGAKWLHVSIRTDGIAPRRQIKIIHL